MHVGVFLIIANRFLINLITMDLEQMIKPLNTTTIPYRNHTGIETSIKMSGVYPTPEMLGCIQKGFNLSPSYTHKQIKQIYLILAASSLTEETSGNAR